MLGLCKAEAAGSHAVGYRYCNKVFILANLVSFDMLVIDDFGLMQLDLNKCRNLFEVLESRDPGRSTMVVSQFPVSAWYDLFQEHTYADACLNRLLHNSYRLEINGKNMRDLTPLNK